MHAKRIKLFPELNRNIKKKEKHTTEIQNLHPMKTF
jgi:hypothetical protein